MNLLRVKNWNEFQHYGDRNMVWVKLYLSLLDDYDFSKLTDAEAGQLMKIWLFAGRSKVKGTIPDDAEWVAKQVNATGPLSLDGFVELGWLIREEAPTDALAHTDKSVLAQGNKDVLAHAVGTASLEEKREEKSREEEKRVENTPSQRARSTAVAGWDDFLAEVPAGPLQDSIADAMRSARHPDALRRTLVALTKSIEGGPSYRPPLIAKAIEELLVNGPVTPIGLRTFCENLARGAKPALKVVNGGAPPAQPLPRL